MWNTKGTHVEVYVCCKKTSWVELH